MKVVVVGAGLAGLTAAEELARAGAEVVVFEARERVGGRVASPRLPNGAVVELGAEFVLPGNTAVRELADRYGLGFWDKGIRYGWREPRGGPGTTQDELAVAVAEVERALAAGAGADRSARELLDGVRIPAGAREAILARVEISCANAAERVAAADLAGVAHIDREPSPSVAGGNGRLAEALAAALPDGVRLDTAVRRVAWEDAAVEVDGETADAAVVAVPAGVLDRIEFDPPLPRHLAGAFASIEYGHAAKLFVPLAGPAPPSAVMNVPERWWCWTATGEDDLPQPLVSAFAGSRRALDDLRVEEGPERWLDSLERLRPDLELDRTGAVLSTWSDDPWVRAAYSTSPPPAVAEAVAAPTGPLAFAGEHTAGGHYALMEGAIRSGRRAARSLLRTRA